jgi:hypothetical protein
MELDCNTIFDASVYRECPTCGSIEFYPLESWLNRDRSQKAPGVETAAFPSARRTRWLWRLRGARVESESRVAPAPVRLQDRAVRRRRAG